mmetsp:Transcript_4166/g.12202  ORF Transcript_4166/g.12202 Transcript_4166/m.12202 type:complete len:264 (-) Transcript_4166:1026-1817(-)
MHLGHDEQSICSTRTLRLLGELECLRRSLLCLVEWLRELSGAPVGTLRSGVAVELQKVGLDQAKLHVDLKCLVFAVLGLRQSLFAATNCRFGFLLLPVDVVLNEVGLHEPPRVADVLEDLRRLPDPLHCRVGLLDLQKQDAVDQKCVSFAELVICLTEELLCLDCSVDRLSEFALGSVYIDEDVQDHGSFTSDITHLLHKVDGFLGSLLRFAEALLCLVYVGNDVQHCCLPGLVSELSVQFKGLLGEWQRLVGEVLLHIQVDK